MCVSVCLCVCVSGGTAIDQATGEYNTDDIDKRLEVLLQQQKQMEKWKPKNAMQA